MAEVFTAETLALMMSGMSKDSIIGSAEQGQMDREAALLDRIIGRVREGKATPEYGDRFARFFGLGSISNPPDPSDIDIKRLGFWNLEMVVAWIIWRDTEAVLRHYRPFCTGHRIWVRNDPSVVRVFPPVRAKLPPEPLGFTTAELNPTNLLSPFRTMSGAIERFTCHKWATNALGGVLMRSEITASARRISDQRDMEIPASQWQHIRPVQGQDGGTELQCGATRYSKVSFPSADVLRIWPDVDVMERRLKYRSDIRPLKGKSLKVEIAIRDRWPKGIELKYYNDRQLRDDEIKKELNKTYPGAVVHSEEAFSKMVKRALSHLFCCETPPN